MVWYLLGIISIVLLALYFGKGSNSVWGGLTIGIIVGLLIAVILFIKGNGFGWYVVGKTSVVGILIGFGAELLGKAGGKFFKK